MNATEFLAAATAAISDRASERDVEQERSMARAVAIFNAATRRDLTEREGWLFQVCLKMARAQGGVKERADDYIDMAAYAALMGEAAMRGERVSEAEPQKLPLLPLVVGGQYLTRSGDITSVLEIIEAATPYPVRCSNGKYCTLKGKWHIDSSEWSFDLVERIA